MGSGGRRVGASEDRRIDRMNVGGKRDAELAPLARRIGPRRCTLALERALTRSLRLLCLNASSALGSADMLASAVRVPPRLAGAARSEARGPAEKMDLSSMRPSKTLKPQGLRSLARVTGQPFFSLFFLTGLHTKKVTLRKSDLSRIGLSITNNPGARGNLIKRRALRVRGTPTTPAPSPGGRASERRSRPRA